MSFLLLAKLAYLLAGVVCYGICGWVIHDNFKQHRWWKFEQQLKAEYKLLELEGWPFYDGRGA